MIEDLEANFIGKPIDAPNLDDLEVAKEENSNEYITAVAKDINVMEIYL